jgi:hypothetical protein
MTKEQQVLAEKYAGYSMSKIEEDYPIPFNAEVFNPAVYELIPPGQSQPEAKPEPTFRKAAKLAKAKPAIESTATRIDSAPVGGLDTADFEFSDEDLGLD